MTPEERREYNRNWRDNNPDYQSKWRARHPDYWKRYAKKSSRIPLTEEEKKQRRKLLKQRHRIADNLRNRVNQCVRAGSRSGSAVQDLGCTIEEFKVYIAAQFQPGMSWDNWGTEGWHLDHIRPLASFDLTDRQQFLAACHYTNYQPLWASDNIRKGCKVI